MASFWSPVIVSRGAPRQRRSPRAPGWVTTVHSLPAAKMPVRRKNKEVKMKNLCKDITILVNNVSTRERIYNTRTRVCVCVYGSVLVSCSTTISQTNTSGRLITATEVFQKTYQILWNTYQLLRSTYKLLRNTFVFAPEHFRNCSGTLW